MSWGTRGYEEVAVQMCADTLTLEVAGFFEASLSEREIFKLETLVVEMAASLNRRMRCQH